MAPRNTGIRIEGYTQYMKAIQHAPKDVKKESRDAFREVGRHVRDDADLMFSTYAAAGAGRTVKASHMESGAAYRVVVRQRGVEVDSRKRKTTGRHKEYGAAQMRHALNPATIKNLPFLKARMEYAMKKVNAGFERRAL